MLTGAIDVALGAGAAGVFTNSDDMWNKLQKVMSIKLPQFILYLEIFSLSYYLHMCNCMRLLGIVVNYRFWVLQC